LQQLDGAPWVAAFHVPVKWIANVK